MSRYAKKQEYRLQRHIEKFGGKVLEYYGSRYKNKGDVLADFDGKTIRFDHKSCQSERLFKFDLAWMPKLLNICNNNVESEGLSFPAISFGYKGHPDMFVCSYGYVLPENFPVVSDIFTIRYNDIYLGELIHALNQGGGIWPVKFDHQYDRSIGKFYTLETYIKGELK